MSTKSHVATSAEISESHTFHLIDAEGQILGRLASQVATLLQGKHKPIYTPFLDTGDHVVIVNAEKIVMTGRKLDQKLMRHHTGYPGGLKEITYRKAMESNPVKVVTEAVRRMLPKSRLGRQMLKKLRVYAGSTHPHLGQQPVPFQLER